MTLDKQAKEYLAQMLEGYEKNHEQMTEFITNTEQQLENVIAQRNEVTDRITGLKGILGLEDETEETEETEESKEEEAEAVTADHE